MDVQGAKRQVGMKRMGRRAEISGSVVVALMFAFGAVATAGLWTYWYYHTQPFIPLQEAISAEFKGSAPRVDGGARKLHKGTPTLLWIIMRVDFRPDLDREKAASVSRRVVELSQEHLDLSAYEQLNIRLFFGELEKEIHTLDAEVPIEAGKPELNSVTAESLAENAETASQLRRDGSPWLTPPQAGKENADDEGDFSREKAARTAQ
ncbi:MAG: hypothetical protein ACYTGL_04270 [Planctomycetota bacterium]